MTGEVEPVAAVEPNPFAVARELAAVTMLASQLKRRADRLRAHVRDWAVGSKQVLELPNPDNPKDPYRVGEIRCDGGAVTASVSDPEAFLAWVQANAPVHLIEQPKLTLAPDSPPAELLPVLTALPAAVGVRTVGPFAEPAAEVVWSVLLAAGWTVTPVEVRAASTSVHAGYTADVLRKSQEAKEPCAPGGLIPDGVSVAIADPKPYVKVTSDGALVGGFVSALRGLPLAEAAALILDNDD